ncbi:hypothetical protein [Streptomyces sp. RK76]|uniref:hypothetical protein n=1 Tax=Streptomyces sp. RK76 TaxID=2824896 RepID=UPI001B382EB1|nr:hypothetical protein [Streptomyces sp. RK76]MBQ0947645.1 hypothetical protein [Streptomyces sp. RK76]
MPSLPPPVWADLQYDGVWNDIAEDVRVTTAPVTVTRGLSSESTSEADPTACTCDLDSRDDRYAPRNPMSPLWGLIGRNTPFRWGYTVGSPWVELNTVENALTTPGSTAFAVVDLDVRLDIALDVWADRDLAARYLPTGDNRSWAVTVDETGQLVLYWTPIGIVESRIAVFSTVPVGAYHGQRLAIRVTLDVDNGAGGYTVRFYTGRTVDDTEWEPLGDPVVGAATTAVFDGIADIELGRVLSISGDAMVGRLYAFRLLDGIGGTVVASMDTSDAAPGDTSFTSGGLVWTTVNGAALSNRHVRMTGEVPAWPPTRDLSGNDNVVSIAPTGITRRMDAGNKPQDSALRRFIQGRGPLECWPLTDGVDSKAAKSLLGGRDMVHSLTSGDVTPSWAAGTLTDWIEPVVAGKVGDRTSLLGYTPRVTNTGDSWSVDMFLTGGSTDGSWSITFFDTGAQSDAEAQVSIIMLLSGDDQTATMIRHSEYANTSSESLLGNYFDFNIFDSQPHYLRLTVEPAPSPFWTIYLDGVHHASGPLDVAMKPVSAIRFGFGGPAVNGRTDQALGYLTYWDDTAPTPAEMWDACLGFQGEPAGDRIQRLATEAGYTASVSGPVDAQQLMGIQDRAKLLDLLNECNVTDFGYLLDARDRAEVIQRGGYTLWNQPPALVLDYSAGLIGAPFKPVDDDKLTENDVSVKRKYGSVPARWVLEEGALSVQDPPLGVGRYDNEYTYSLATDDQAGQVAAMRLHLGTYDGVRYTRITLNLANSRVFAMIDDILRIDVGDKIRLTNLPADHGPDDVDVLVHGYEEAAGPDAWTLTFNCRPAEPWTTGVVDSPDSRLDTDGSALTSAVDTTSTTIALKSTTGESWTTDPADFPFDVRVGGEVMRLTACLPALLDTFGRTTSNGWGTASSGLAWTSNGGAASDYSVASGTGRISNATSGTRRIMSLPVALTDVDSTITWAMPVVPSGDSGYVMLAARYGGPDSQYFARVQVASGGAATLTLRKRVAGTETQLASLALGWSVTAGTRYRLRLSVAGTSLTAKAWREADAEPGAWQLTAADSDLTGSADLAVWSLVGSGLGLPFVVQVDDVQVGGQLATVVRSVNGITKSHAAGTDVRLAHPTYVAL